MRRQIARAAENLTIASAVGAFATLLFTLSSLGQFRRCTLALVTAVLGLLAIVGACVGTVAKQASEPEL